MFFSRNKLETTNDSEWLKGLQIIIPDAILCLESRPLGECKTISAAVRVDSKTLTTSVFVNVSLQWLKNLVVAEVVPELNITEERPRLPQLIISGESMEQFNTICEAKVFLISPDKKATYICFPWPPERMEQLKATKRWLFWSLSDEKAGKGTYYFGYGSFESVEAFDRYVQDVTNG
jgi:hypothetical protein